MGRKASGSVYYVEATSKRPGHYAARLTKPDGNRIVVHLDPSPRGPKYKAKAESDARVLSDRLRDPDAPAPEAQPVHPLATETVSEYIDRWVQSCKTAGTKDAANYRSRLNSHVVPHVGSLPIVHVTPDDCRKIVRALITDANNPKVRLSTSTAHKKWQTFTQMLDEACNSNDDSLRVLDTNPSDGVRGPRKGKGKATQWLYPDEALRLLRSPEVPLGWRRFYALSIYLYQRPG